MSIYYSDSLIYECPECESKSLRVILNSNQLPVHNTVGVCRDAINCGYAYLESDYKKDNPIKKEPAFIDFKKVQQSLDSYSDNYFYIFLLREFGLSLAKKAVDEYYIGTSFRQMGASIFWHLDAGLRVCEGLIRTVNPETGSKPDRVDAISIYKLTYKIELPEPSFFGGHLIEQYPNKQKVIVWDHVDAVIGSIVYPENLWLTAPKYYRRNFYQALWPNSVWFPKKGYEKLNSFSEKSTRPRLKISGPEVLPYSLKEKEKGV